MPPGERIVTIEDAAELRLLQRHVVPLETRPPNVEGDGEISIRDLVRNALRMRPDRIIVGEVRGAEALDMLQAMNTGHDGSLTTVHANSARDALHRLEMLVLMAGVELPIKAIREQIAGGFDLLVHIARLVDGSRRVTQITEIAGMEGDVITLQDLYVARLRESRSAERAPICSVHSARRGSGPAFSRSSTRTASSWRRRPGWGRDEEARPRSSRRGRGRPPGGRGRGRSGAVQIRRVDPAGFPLVRVTAVVPAGSRPVLARGRPSGGVRQGRELGSAEAIVLAVDNSASMTGGPLREAKRAAAAFLSRQRRGATRARRVRARGAVADAARVPNVSTSHGCWGPSRRIAEVEPRSTTRSGLSVGRLKQDVERYPGPRPADGRSRSRLAKLAGAGDAAAQERERHRLRDRSRPEGGS